MPLTTSYPAPAGIYWTAALYGTATFLVTAQHSMRNVPKGRVHLPVSARFATQPPQTATFEVSARYEIVAGTESIGAVGFPAVAAFTAGFSPRTSAKFSAAVAYSFAGTEITAPVPQSQVNVAVTRAATI